MPSHDAPRIHIQNPDHLTIALCGRRWSRVSRGGRIASDTEPPVVKDDESGSCDVATCDVCLAKWRRLRTPAAPRQEQAQQHTRDEKTDVRNHR